MIVFGQKWCFREKLFGSGKIGCIRAKFVLFGQSCGIPVKTGCVQAKWLYADKSGLIRAKIVLFGQKWLYSVKVFVYG